MRNPLPNSARDTTRIPPRCGLPLILLLASCPLAAAGQTATPPNFRLGLQTSQQQPPSTDKQQLEPKKVVSRRERAWKMLESAAKGDDISQRRTAVRVLGLMRDDPRGLPLAQHALDDGKAQVRMAAAVALADLQAPSSIPALRSALEKEDDPAVILAMAHALVLLQDEEGFHVYYEILTGQRKAKKSMIGRQTDILTDPKKLAKLGFVQGLGFVPFGGMGWAALQELRKGDPTPIRAASAGVLADDPDADATQALVEAAGDNHWLVRAAALEALARRGDTAAASSVSAYFPDDNEVVRFTAAAAYLELIALENPPDDPNPEQAGTQTTGAP